MSRLKEYKDDFLALPNPVKAVVYFIVIFLVLAVIHQAATGIHRSRKIEKLEAKNVELSVKAAKAENRAASAEQNAANEAANRKQLEEKSKILEKKIKNQDEKIAVQSTKSNSARNDLDRVRVSRPANIGTERLERRLEDRYGQTKRSQ